MNEFFRLAINNDIYNDSFIIMHCTIIVLLLLLIPTSCLNLFNKKIKLSNNIQSNTTITINTISNSNTTITKNNHNSIMKSEEMRHIYDSDDIIKYIKISSYFVIWYVLTIVYNISSKRLLDIFPFPATISVLQLILGIPVFLPIWLFKSPSISTKHLEQYSKIAFFHGMGNYATCISLGAGAVSFTHIIKAAEPIFSAILSATIYGTVFPFEVYLSLFPIVVGVGLASAKELSFTWISFISAMASNLFYQLRIVLAKKEMTNTNTNTNTNSKSNDKVLSKMESNSTITVPSRNQDEISPENLFRIITIISAIQLLPIALLVEGSTLQTAYSNIVTNGNYEEFLSSMLISGVSYYMYNEVAFWILGLVHPITHAVGNTIKRVVIIFASIILLKTPITLQGALGSFIAILGTFTYSLVLFQYEKKQRNKDIDYNK